MHAPYHEQFWVIAGAAAPVIALALALAMSDLYRGVMLPPQRVDGSFTPVAIGTFAIALIDFVLMAFLLFESLASIYMGKDAVSPVFGLVVAPVGLLLVLFASVETVLLRLTASETANANREAPDGRVLRRAIKRGLVVSSPVRRRP